MIKIILGFILTIASTLGLASEHQKIDTLGTSSKGQYIALEEYGYKAAQHSFYVTIKIMNVWKKEYVGFPVVVELPAHRPDYLAKARERAKIMAKDQLKKFNINT